MNILNFIQADQVIPISKARPLLSSLIEDLEEKHFLVLARKYKPKAALVDLSFFEKLLEVYQRWIRDQDFATVSQIKKSLPSYPKHEIENDIAYAIKKVRGTK